MIYVGSTVKVILNVREQGSLGVVTFYSPSTKLFCVELQRVHPPFRGLYTQEELEKAK